MSSNPLAVQFAPKLVRWLVLDAQTKLSVISLIECFVNLLTQMYCFVIVTLL